MNTLGYLGATAGTAAAAAGALQGRLFDCLNAIVFVSQAASVAFQNSRLLPLVTLLGAPS